MGGHWESLGCNSVSFSLNQCSVDGLALSRRHAFFFTNSCVGTTPNLKSLRLYSWTWRTEPPKTITYPPKNLDGNGTQLQFSETLHFHRIHIWNIEPHEWLIFMGKLVGKKALVPWILWDVVISRRPSFEFLGARVDPMTQEEFQQYYTKLEQVGSCCVVIVSLLWSHRWWFRNPKANHLLDVFEILKIMGYLPYQLVQDFSINSFT